MIRKTQSVKAWCEKHKCETLMSYYDKQGKKLCCTLSWGKLVEYDKYRIIDHTEKDGVTVSTVWMGIDCGRSLYGKRRKPVIFESLVYGLPNEDEICERYCTLKEAQKGHRILCGLYLK